jgi:L-ascorbate 6-phosphate lactonase
MSTTSSSIWQHPTASTIAQIRAHSTGTALWWLGNAGWAIKSEDVLLLIDPVIEMSESDPALSEIDLALVHDLPIRASDFGEADLDLCIVTHAHGDHLAPLTVPTLARQTQCRFVVPDSCLDEMRRLGIAEERMIPARHGQTIRHKHLTIEPVKALHGHIHGSVYAEANFQDCGYVVRDRRWTIFHPGDTVLLHEHLEMAPPDVFLASITEHNLWVKNTALLGNLWRPRYVLPMHYDTYAEPIFWTIGDPRDVVPHLDEAVRPGFRPLAQGEKLLLEG